jgi:HEAT repeat protein
MLTKISIILLGSLLVLTATGSFRLRAEKSLAEASLLRSAFIGPCQSSRSGYIHKLSSDSPEAYQAVNKLIEEAKESQECRDAIINELMLALKEADLQNDQSAFLLWARGSAILGNLKAVEALDLLIDHLDLTDGLFSASMVHQPVVPAVQRMGEVAIPKLGFALKHHPKRDIRLAAALCLLDIDGPQALKEVNSALDSETDPCVRRFIMLSLPTPTDTSNSNRRLTARDGDILMQRLLAFKCAN